MEEAFAHSSKKGYIENSTEANIDVGERITTNFS